jgi:hypothetical protein
MPDQVREADTLYGQKPLLTREEIEKIVEVSQRIEGYEPTSKAYEAKVEAYMQEHRIEISVQ